MKSRLTIISILVVAPILAACANFGPGAIFENVVLVPAGNSSEAEVDRLQAWQTENGYVLTGRLMQFGSEGLRRGHIHVRTADDSAGQGHNWSAFTDRGKRITTALKVSRFSVNLGKELPPGSKFEVRYHSGAHS
jgi:hypothetical protein